MKYIRTKDELGIYIEYDGEYKDLNKGTYFKTWRGVYIHEDWKVADTIEELCDEFILHYLECKDKYNIPWATYEQRGIWQKEKQHIISEIVKHPPYRKPILYGAIWTEKGLIYAAKMNDAGELELL